MSLFFFSLPDSSSHCLSPHLSSCTYMETQPLVLSAIDPSAFGKAGNIMERWGGTWLSLSQCSPLAAYKKPPYSWPPLLLYDLLLPSSVHGLLLSDCSIVTHCQREWLRPKACGFKPNYTHGRKSSWGPPALKRSAEAEGAPGLHVAESPEGTLTFSVFMFPPHHLLLVTLSVSFVTKAIGMLSLTEPKGPFFCTPPKKAGKSIKGGDWGSYQWAALSLMHNSWIQKWFVYHSLPQLLAPRIGLGYRLHNVANTPAVFPCLSFFPLISL